VISFGLTGVGHGHEKGFVIDEAGSVKPIARAG